MSKLGIKILLSFAIQLQDMFIYLGWCRLLTKYHTVSRDKVNRTIVNIFVYSYHEWQHFIVHQVFKNLDFLGWYTTGSGPTENDIRVHKQVNKTSRILNTVLEQGEMKMRR